MEDKLMTSEYFKAGKPIHKTSYCAFLDILGFSERMMKSYDNNNGNTLLDTFHTIFQERLSKLKDEEQYFLFFKTFSDNVLLAHPQYSHDMESEFAFIMWALREYQFRMALEGFFIRGGLSVGPLFIGADNVYGKALIEAYELESKIAVNPIVVLSNAVIELVNAHVKFYSDEEAPQLRDILKGSDGRYFINYLTECISEIEGGYKINSDELNLHKDRIIEGLMTYVDKPQVFSKYSWLAAYHNYFCDSVSRISGYNKALKIKSKLSTVQFSRINK